MLLRRWAPLGAAEAWVLAAARRLASGAAAALLVWLRADWA